MSAYNTVSRVEKSTFAELHKKLEEATQHAEEAEQHVCSTCLLAPKSPFSLCPDSKCHNECLTCMTKAFSQLAASCAYCKFRYPKPLSATLDDAFRLWKWQMEGAVMSSDDD